MDNKKNGIPKLRFPGFTGAWEQRKLGEEFKRVNERNNGEFGKDRWISVAKMYFQDPDKVTSNNIDTRTYVMRLGDIAFEGNSNNEFKFGRFVANDIGDGVVSELFPIYRHIRDYDNNYWKYAIHLERIMRPIFAKSITSSGSSSNKLAPKDLLRQSIFLPNLDEQKKIGAFFINIDSLIALHQRKLEHLQEQKKGLLQKMFPKNGETVPEVRFPGFTDAWEQRKWVDSINISNEMVDPTTGKFDDMPHIAPGNIESFTGRILDNVKTVKEEELISGKFLFKPGDVVFGKINPQLGKYFYARVEGLTSADSYVLNGKNKNITQMFIFLLLQTRDFFKYSVSVSKRSGIPKINREELNGFKFLIPCKEEQEKIGDFFLNIDSLIALHQRKLDHLELMKKGLLQQMFV